MSREIFQLLDYAEEQLIKIKKELEQVIKEGELLSNKLAKHYDKKKIQKEKEK